MSPDTNATGRPQQTIPVLPRMGMALFAAVLLFEAFRGGGRFAPLGGGLVRGIEDAAPGSFATYERVRAFMFEQPWSALSIAVGGCALFLVLYRWWLLLWHNEVVARLSGTKLERGSSTLPVVKVDLFAELAKRPPLHHFVGLSPKKTWRGVRWEPIYVSPAQRSMHRHVLGKTGSGKTLSVLWPAVLQSALDGQGVVVVSGKGSDEEIQTMKGIAKLAGRETQLKVFSLPAWNQPHLFTHTYNFVYVRPRTPTDTGGDPAAMADRVFSVLPLGDNEYYNVQAQIMFSALARLLQGMVDARGFGIPFVLKDMAVCLRGIGQVGGWSRAFEYCRKTSVDRDAAMAVESQIQQLGKDVNKCFSGLVGALDKFLAPMVNAYEPDLIFEEVLEKGLLVYVQLPANLFPVQAPATGRAILMDIQQEGSLRQVFRQTRSQRPFGVMVDEFYNFADLHIVDSLNKLRDARLEYLLAHQSIADLELVSKEFATAVWDNTRTKFVLAQDNPELCEKVAKSIGTHQVVEQTVRVQQGALFTSLTTGDASTKLVETFRLHPNAIKQLAEHGQGYLLFGGGEPRPVCFGMMPNVDADFPLPRLPQRPGVGLRLYERFVIRDGLLERG
jgi:hypothetical protein